MPTTKRKYETKKFCLSRSKRNERKFQKAEEMSMVWGVPVAHAILRMVDEYEHRQVATRFQ